MIAQTQQMPLAQNNLIKTAVNTMSRWFKRIHDRRELMKLNDHLLKDIGMARWEVHQEYEKPFWVM